MIESQESWHNATKATYECYIIAIMKQLEKNATFPQKEFTTINSPIGEELYVGNYVLIPFSRSETDRLKCRLKIAIFLHTKERREPQWILMEKGLVLVWQECSKGMLLILIQVQSLFYNELLFVVWGSWGPFYQPIEEIKRFHT